MSWQGANAAQNGRAFGARCLIAHPPPGTPHSRPRTASDYRRACPQGRKTGVFRREEGGGKCGGDEAAGSCPPSQSVPGALQVLAGLAGGKRFPPLPRLPQPCLLCLLSCSGGFQVRRIRFRPQTNLLTATSMRSKAFSMFLPQNSY